MSKLQTTFLENLDRVLTEGIYDPSIFKVVFLAGGPGSGKSFVSGKTTAGLGFRVVNSDEIIEVLLKASGLGLDMGRMTPDQIRQKDLIRDKAKALTDKRLQGYLQGRLGLVIDGTGKDYNKIAKQKANFESIGYDTFMIFVNTSLEVAQARNLLRERKVQMELVQSAWHEVQQNIGKFNQLFGQRFVVIDNNKNISDEELFTNVFKKIMNFSKQAPDNLIAKKWIADYYKLR